VAFDPVAFDVNVFSTDVSTAMATNARFLYANYLWEAATTVLAPSVGAWLTERPLSFLQKPWRKKVARSVTSGSTAGVDIIIDLGSIRSVNSVVLVNPKKYATGAITLSAHASNSWGSPTYGPITFPTVNTLRRLTVLYIAQSFRYWRIHFTNPGAGNEFVELGTIFIGSYYEPTFNITEQLRIKPEDPSEVVEAYDGEVQGFKKTHYDVVGAFLESMPASDRNTFRNMWMVNGRTSPLVLAVDGDDLNITYYGYLEEVDFDFAKGTIDDWDIGFNFKEAR
jgi:hypothetical protein